MQVSWSDIKSLIASSQTRLNFVERENEYLVVASATNIAFTCVLEKGSSSAIEFESTYKNNWVHLVQPIDSDGSVILRNKTTRSGWHYEPRSLDFTTSVAGSLYNRKHDGNLIDTGTDYGDCTIKFFNSSGVEISQQSVLDTDCVRTQIDWHPTYEMDIIGATVSALNPPSGNQRAYAWVIVAPDIPAQFGGSVPFLAGGWNLRHFAGQGSGTTVLNGRGVKTFLPDPVNKTNKFRVVVKHDPGLKIELQFVAEHFKA